MRFIVSLRILRPSGEADIALRNPEQYRKLPNGLFTITKNDHILDIPLGTQVPLLCLWEKFQGRAAPGANQAFLTKKVFIDHAPSVPKRKGFTSTRIGDMTPEEHEYCSQKFNELIERKVGKGNYPKGDGLRKEKVWVGRLFACEGDAHASTIILEDANKFYHQGGRTPVRQIDIGLPLRFYIHRWRREYARRLGLPSPKLTEAIRPKSVEERAEERLFREEANDEKKAYGLVEQVIRNTMNDSRYGLVQAPEGIRKTTAAMEHVPALIEKLNDDEISGLPEDANEKELENAKRYTVVFAFGNYKLAAEKADQFNSINQDTRYKGVVLRSFSKEYAHCLKALNVKQAISKTYAAQMGYSSQIAAIRDEQPQVWSMMEKRHSDFYKDLQQGVQEIRPVFFTAHQTLHNWDNEGITSAYWHKDFFRTDPKEWWRLRKEIRPRLVVHDEVSVDNLVEFHRAEKVEWYFQMKEGQSCWEGPNSLSERYKVFENHKNDHPTTIDFEEVCEIHDIEYSQSDLQTVLGLEKYDNENA
jgi:hypothetical protein